ncbi:26997_t:CDS:2, partial [Racocetra persica]
PSTSTLTITFNYAIAFSTGNITIYKASDNSIRQRVSATMNNFCKITKDGFNVSIKVIASTFNEYGEQYFVTMDNNFVKENSRPLKGINDGIWILKSDESIKVVIGSVRLTIDASKNFSVLSKDNQSAYFDTLLNELADKVPIHRSHLSSNNRFYNRFYNLLYDQIVILIRINRANNETERTASEASSDLNNMIIYKNITAFSFGVTNDLDQDYGFTSFSNAWNEYTVQIIVEILIFLILYLVSRILSYKLKLKELEAISSAILVLGLIIPNFILSSFFVAYNSNDVLELYWPRNIPQIIIQSIDNCIKEFQFKATAFEK